MTNRNRTQTIGGRSVAASEPRVFCELCNRVRAGYKCLVCAKRAKKMRRLMRDGMGRDEAFRVAFKRPATPTT